MNFLEVGFTILAVIVVSVVVIALAVPVIVAAAVAWLISVGTGLPFMPVFITCCVIGVIGWFSSWASY